jgi:hypothetical protein
VKADPAQLAALKRFRDELPYYAECALKIKNKAGKQVPLLFNRAQKYVHERLEAQKAEKGWVRALILKARQQGFSTYIGARFYHRASLFHGTSVYILTHEQAATDNLFGMVQRYHENTPLKPSTGAANAKELLFNKLDSGYAVGTAGQKAVGRSKTIQLLHGSEAAFWPNAKEHFGGVVQAVPNLPGTEIILESTANGIGGEFHQRWQDAEEGVGDYIAIFVPWFWSDEYRRPVPDGFALSSEKTEDQQYSETEYAEAYGLTLSQMVWRRAKVAELGELLFMQEYPATAQEAFQVTGHDSFIKPAKVLQARKAELEGIGPLVLGADPARFGDDSFSLAWRQGRKVLKTESKEKLDTVAGANWIKGVIDKDNPAKVFIDVGGQGAGVFDILVSYGPPYSKICVAVNFGGAPQDEEVILEDGTSRPGAKNRRAEMWHRSREWLSEVGGADIPDDNLLQRDACGPSYRYDTNQRLVLESKEAMRVRGLKSPDRWDAIVLTFAQPVHDKSATKTKKKVVAHSRVRGATGWMAA